jgi:hypothetical protein
LRRTTLRHKWSTAISKAAENLSKTGCSWGCVLAIDSNGRTIWIVDARRNNGKRLAMRANEKLTSVLELESTIRACDELV